VLPPDTEWFNHLHTRQDELYFVHVGTAGFEVDGETFELGPGGAVHVERRRRFSAGDMDAIRRRDRSG
jgi:mannose-6-phosphate isomerase-like protein (cupin superfamily)